MVHRVALIIGAFGAVALVALALVLGGSPIAALGLGGAAEDGVEQLVADAPPSTPSPDGNRPKVVTVVDEVYIEPAPADDASVASARGSGNPSRTADATSPPDATPMATDDWDDDRSGRGDDERRGDGGDDRRGHRDDEDDDRGGRGDGGDDFDDDDFTDDTRATDALGFDSRGTDNGGTRTRTRTRTRGG